MHKGFKSSTQSQREEEAEVLKDVQKKRKKKDFILFNFLIYHFNGYFLIWRHLIFLH